MREGIVVVSILKKKVTVFQILRVQPTLIHRSPNLSLYEQRKVLFRVYISGIS